MQRREQVLRVPEIEVAKALRIEEAEPIAPLLPVFDETFANQPPYNFSDWCLTGTVQRSNA